MRCRDALVSAHAWGSIAITGLLSGCSHEARSDLDAGLNAGADAHDVAPSWPDAAVPGEAGPADGAPLLSWQRSEVALEPDGRSALLSFALGALQRPVFALRTYAAPSDGMCFQLEDVHADEATWVPTATSADYGDFCTRCEQRVAVGRGYGMFVLPSASQPEHVDTLRLRIALRDCLTLSPLSIAASRPRSLVVESASYAATPGDAPLELPLLIVAATPEAFSGGAGLDDTFARVREIWRRAGIELLLRGPLVLPRPGSPLEYSATDREALSALAHAAEEAGVEASAPRVLLTPCLLRRDSFMQGVSQPLAFTTHVPGGFAVGGEADGIFVAAERCGGLTAAARYMDSASLAAVIAHELGHYLGLFHVHEADGREDTLADTRVDEPNLMQALPHADATTLSENQVAIARRHPALAARASNDQQAGRH